MMVPDELKRSVRAKFCKNKDFLFINFKFLLIILTVIIIRGQNKFGQNYAKIVVSK